MQHPNCQKRTSFVSPGARLRCRGRLVSVCVRCARVRKLGCRGESSRECCASWFQALSTGTIECTCLGRGSAGIRGLWSTFGSGPSHLRHAPFIAEFLVADDTFASDKSRDILRIMDEDFRMICKWATKGLGNHVFFFIHVLSIRILVLRELPSLHPAIQFRRRPSAVTCPAAKVVGAGAGAGRAKPPSCLIRDFSRFFDGIPRSPKKPAD